jgi:hypothetical protein
MYGPNKEKLVIGLEEPLSQANIELIRNKKLVETIKLPFKRPISVTKIGKGLASEEIQELAQILRETGNRIAARNLERMIADATAVRSLALGAKGAVNSIFSLSRYDPRTGEVISGQVQRASISSGREPAGSRTPARGGAAPRSTSISSGREPAGSRAPAREGAAPRSTSISSGRESVGSRAPARTAERTSPTQPRTTPEAPRTPATRVNPPRTNLSTPNTHTTVKTTYPNNYDLRDRRKRERRKKQDSKTIIQFPAEKGSELTKAEREASVAWKQGHLRQGDQFIVVHPPYTNESRFWTTKVPEGVHIVDGPRSAYDTLNKITGGKLPPEINLDMGIMDIEITARREIPKLKFMPDPNQRTHQGRITNRRPRASSPRIRTSR